MKLAVAFMAAAANSRRRTLSVLSLALSNNETTRAPHAYRKYGKIKKDGK